MWLTHYEDYDAHHSVENYLFVSLSIWVALVGIKKSTCMLVMIYIIINNHVGGKRQFLDHQQVTLIWTYHLF
jgi:hypothetical protein